MGSIVGRADSTTVTRCSVTCSLRYANSNTNDIFIGGLVGRSYSGTVTDCVVTGSVYTDNTYYKANVYMGGVLGYASGATVTRCLSDTTCTAKTGKTPVVGGLVGYMEEYTKVTDSISLGSGNAESYDYYEPFANIYCAYSKTGATCSNCYKSGTYTESFFTSTLGWSTSVWDLSPVANGQMPVLIQS